MLLCCLWPYTDLLHGQILQPIEFPPNTMAEVAMRPRQVAASSGSDLCSQVAALDWPWRRPVDTMSVDTVHKETSDPIAAPTFNRPDRVAGGSRHTGCNEPLVHPLRLINDLYKRLSERLHCAAGRSTHQKQPAIFNARSRLPGKQCSALAAPRNLTSSPLYQSFLTYRERTDGSLQPMRREPPAT